MAAELTFFCKIKLKKLFCYFTSLCEELLSVIIQCVVQQEVRKVNGRAHLVFLVRSLMSKIKPVFKCEEHFKATFKDSKCLLTISVGQEVHEGDKFEKTIGLVNQAFQSCVVLIDDTLQRHTMAIETNSSSGDDLLGLSKQEGELWFERSRLVINQLTIPYKIITWDDWLGHSKFNSIKSVLNILYCQDAIFNGAIEDTINEFLTRYDRRSISNNFVSDPRARKLCYDYLIEECVAMHLWTELGCHFEVYPSRRNAAMSEIHRRFVLPQHPDLLHSVRIKFKNKKQLKPQVFSALANRELLVSDA
jgi:hypothetical protein